MNNLGIKNSWLGYGNQITCLGLMIPSVWSICLVSDNVTMQSDQEVGVKQIKHDFLPEDINILYTFKCNLTVNFHMNYWFSEQKVAGLWLIELLTFNIS